MTSLDLNPFSEHSLSGDNFLTIPSSFSTLVERIQEYLVAQYEGFLINEVGKIKYHNALIGYQIQLQRGNLMVDLLFDHIGELLNAHLIIKSRSLCQIKYQIRCLLSTSNNWLSKISDRPWKC